RRPLPIGSAAPGRPCGRHGRLLAGRRERAMTALVLTGIRRSFVTAGGRARAVDGVDLALARGEVLGLVGESGCGKTTLARIAVGLDRPDAGSVLLEGRPVQDAVGRVGPELRRRLQYVFQEPLGS